MAFTFLPKHYTKLENENKRFKKLSLDLIRRVEGEVKAMLHCHRDTLRNTGKNTLKVTFDVREGFQGEAFGIMRGLNILGYGFFGSDNLDATHDGHPQPYTNLKWWFSKLEHEVLEEEGYYDKTHRCKYCLERYKKDDLTLIEQGKLKQYDGPAIQFKRLQNERGRKSSVSSM